MHEFSIASDIWGSVRAAAERHGGGRVKSIALEIGVLNLIEDEQLRFWVGALAERDGSPGVELRITHVPARVRCRKCKEEGEAEPPEDRMRFFLPDSPACSACASDEVEVVGGRELRVVSAEVEADGEERSS